MIIAQHEYTKAEASDLHLAQEEQRKTMLRGSMAHAHTEREVDEPENHREG